jgi:hypothetical protein
VASDPAQHFTPGEADKLIPRLERMLTALQRLQGSARARYQEMNAIRRVGRASDGRLIMEADFQQARRDFMARVEEAKRLLAELNAMGCRLTDVDLGLVDFPSDVNGEPVYLCWRLGESGVQYFHRRGEGYAARRPLPPSVD